MLLAALALPGNGQEAPQGQPAPVPAPDPETARPGPAFVDTADPAVPGAQELVLDLPNALHWSRQQRGQLGPWHYVLFPDGSATIRRAEAAQTVAAAWLTCQAGVGCRVDLAAEGGFDVPVGRGLRPALPAQRDLASVARYLAAWMLTGTAPPAPPAPAPQAPGPASSDSAPEVPRAEAQTTGPRSAPQGPQGSGAGQARASADPLCAAADPFQPDRCAVTARPASVAVAQPAPLPAAPQPSTAEPEAPQGFVERYRIACSITASAGLAGLGGGAGGDSRGNAKPRASLGCSARLNEQLSLRLTLIGYAQPDKVQDWDPDYTYALTYRVNDTISLTYSNYSARFGDEDGVLAGLLEGSLRLSYRLPAIPLGAEASLPCTAGIGLPRPDRASLSLSCGYALSEKLRLSAATYLYAPGAQDTYQPDYSYTASYRINEDWLVSYQNYSNNRFPWNRGEAPGPGFTGGSVSVTYQMAF